MPKWKSRNRIIFKRRAFNKKDAATRQLHFEDLSYLLIDEINSVFGKHGEIIGLCIEKFSADIIFQKRIAAVAALNAENGSLFLGKVLKISLKDDSAGIKQESDPSDVIVFLPRCDIKPKVEELEISDDQHQQESISNLQDSQIDIKPSISKEVDVSSNFKQLPQAQEDGKEEQRKEYLVYNEFGSYLDKLGPLCNRLRLKSLHIIIFELLKRRFEKYGRIAGVKVLRCFALIQYKTREQAEAAFEAECHLPMSMGKLFGHYFLLEHCQNRRGKNFPRNTSLESLHGQKRKHDESEQQISTSKKFRNSNECQIIVMSNTDNAKSKYYSIKKRLKESGLDIDWLFVHKDMSVSTAMNRDCISIQINPIDEQHEALKVNVVNGKSSNTQKEIRLEDLPTFIIENLNNNSGTGTISHQIHETCQMENRMETSDGILKDAVKDLKENIAQVEKIIENLNTQVALFQKKHSGLEKNNENMKNNKIIQELKKNVSCLKAKANSLKI